MPLRITNVASLPHSQPRINLNTLKSPKRKLYNEFESIQRGGIKIVKKALSPCGKNFYTFNSFSGGKMLACLRDALTTTAERRKEIFRKFELNKKFRRRTRAKQEHSRKHSERDLLMLTFHKLIRKHDVHVSSAVGYEEEKFENFKYLTDILVSRMK